MTAYYSPLPGQCCYVRGSEAADKRLNGHGVQAADGTKVYPGMAAAPSSYAYGTTIDLPGLGVVKVHDRGGAIVEWGSGVHRLDVWMGHGEAGLARALAFGQQTFEATVYPNGTSQPAVALNLDNQPAPMEELRTYFVEKDNLLTVRPKLGDRGLSVTVLQEYLQDLGYFTHAVTGYFGQETHASLANFIRDFRLRTSADQVTPELTAHIIAAHERLPARQPVAEFIEDGASVEATQEAQRILRFLGYYDGPTDGQYSELTKHAIFTFQRNNGLVGDWSSAGAGRIGPITRTRLRGEWNRLLVAHKAAAYLEYNTADKYARRLQTFMQEGNSGKQVQLLQELLADRGFFPAEKINGNFGPLTKQGVAAYQLDRGLISRASHPAAGYVGPNTLRLLRTEERDALFAKVRAEGWAAL